MFCSAIYPFRILSLPLHPHPTLHFSVLARFTKRKPADTNGHAPGTNGTSTAATPTPPRDEKSMSFLDHLEELRWHVVRMVVVLTVAMGVMFANLHWLVQEVVLGPLSKNFPTNQLLCRISPGLCPEKGIQVTLQATDPAEQFTRAILIAVVAGFIVAFPYVVWELWRFVKPGLHQQELKKTRGVVAIVSALFLLGVLFGYYVICPFTLNFFATFQLAPQVQNIWRIGEVIGLIVQISLAGGILFEMPVAAFVLSKLGILKPGVMRNYRKHAVVVVLIVAGILTPSPDVLSQVLLAVPMFMLYEVSILISARVEKARLKAEAELTKNDPPLRLDQQP